MAHDAPAQLALLPDLPASTRAGWRLDRATRLRGLQGVEAARRALAEAASRHEAELAARRGRSAA